MLDQLLTPVNGCTAQTNHQDMQQQMGGAHPTPALQSHQNIQSTNIWLCYGGIIRNQLCTNNNCWSKHRHTCLLNNQPDVQEIIHKCSTFYRYIHQSSKMCGIMASLTFLDNVHFQYLHIKYSWFNHAVRICDEKRNAQLLKVKGTHLMVFLTGQSFLTCHGKKLQYIKELPTKSSGKSDQLHVELRRRNVLLDKKRIISQIMTVLF